MTATDRYTWNDQLSEIAMIRLLLLQAQYEGWLETVASILVPDNSKRRTWVKQMTFPDRFSGALTRLGRSDAMRDLDNASPLHRYRIDSSLSAAIICIRYFKEVRNAAIHSGRRAGPELMKAQRAYAAVQKSGSLATNYRPPTMVSVAAEGDMVEVSHHGIIGLTGLVQRVLATLDAQVATTAAGESYYLAKWARINPHRELAATSPRRKEQLDRLARRVGPVPNGPVPTWESSLRAAHLIRY